MKAATAAKSLQIINAQDIERMVCKHSPVRPPEEVKSAGGETNGPEIRQYAPSVSDRETSQ